MNVVELHRKLVSTPSVSHSESRLADWVEHTLRQWRADVTRLGDNVIARAGEGPLVLLCSHLDTVPANDAWTRDPWTPVEQNGRIYGLGSNDAKASVACMMLAFSHFLQRPEPVTVGLLLAPEEETGGKGVEWAWPQLRERGWSPAAVVVGEPTGLDIATAQKGMITLDLRVTGTACHSAHAHAMDARNPIWGLASDLQRLSDIKLGPSHARLGPTTLQATVVQAGEARNQVPGVAEAAIDIRTVPTLSPDEIVDLVRRQCAHAEVHVRSTRLKAVEVDAASPIVRAAQTARPASHIFASSTMSDMVWFEGSPAIKCGPGDTNRSHRPDEYVCRSELFEGETFYRDLIQTFAKEQGRDHA